MSNLTKSDLMSYFQCPKRLWLEKHKPEEAHDEPDEQIIANGEAVGAAARELFAGGMKVDTLNPDQALADTQTLLQGNAPLFEAAFEHDGVRVRVDIIHGDTLTEVKSGTSVKEHYSMDAAIQAWVTHHGGHPLSKVQLAIVNSDFVYQGNGYDGLLKFEDLTDFARDSYPKIPNLLANARATLETPDPPLVLPGPQCNKPHACPFQQYCEAGRPDYPVESLPRSGKIVDICRQNGITAIADIPENWLTNEIHQRVQRTVRSGKAEIDPLLIETVRNLAFPRYYLDFEAIAFAVPIWVGTRPHQQLPFQWSCHIEQADGSIVHREFLDISGEPPMRSFTKSLIAMLGTDGPIVVYSDYERRMLKSLCELYPDLEHQLEPIMGRLFDLLPLMRKHFYHPQQHGSWSIKALLPIVAPELDYKQLANVHNGTEAQLAFTRCIADDIDPDSKATLESDMLAYCKLDTWAMVKLAHFIQTN